MTTMTLQTQYGEAMITVEQDDMNIDDVLDYLVKPLLLATGYDPDTVLEAVGE